MPEISLPAWPAQLTQMIDRLVSNPWTPRGLNLAALALLVWSLASWTWWFAQPAKAPPPATAPPRPAATAANELHGLLAANLFGVAGGGTALSSLPLTSLNLQLTGVLLLGPNSFALIRVGGGDENAIAIGQEVQPGVRLHAVQTDRAILQRAGMLETLMLLEAGATLPEGSIVGGAARPTAARDLARGSGNQFTVDRDAMLQQLQRPDFLSQALLVPNAGGGFLVREVQAGSVYEKLGVRVGDVVRSINGQPVNTIEDAMRIYQQLGGAQLAGRVNIEVSRAGRPETLQYSFE